MNNETYTVRLLPIDTPLASGRIYGKDVVKSIMSQPNDVFMGTFNQCDSADTEQAAFVVDNLRMDGDYLVADVTPLDTPTGRVLKHIRDDVIFRPAGKGIITTGGIVEDYTMTHVQAVYN